ncbi:LPS-assembly lipoprotein LptE [Pseudoalteromonas carrageenovora]|uniref:LPS-assembly lipoprotein LptE n=1 Tax=Pseudoalteromonas carrageenovora IAM 12662 TaxID=1314868 RepID=A0A2K4X7R1_PSEVC|nr:LPS assembly lipoprotein LptE [Pseudoalteromonas carrageenovora]MBE0382577.1 LPS-assembly lipoprotein [Pseudoalteromonas carrageenovora IAM 12662]MDO6464131.1 LPS assembly lipoprotein LptE [Pseudoalteromonas carrageenovora]QBJ71282.1 LPS-assembly lipoprotein LptE [Pseudoalteromonas carrageenovora]SOU40361.1 LPS-assembly lipoprotein LptE [Pseudoalteromonas carrageenovora IAM 12662]GEB71730.1 LPS-assembly lipoprotein LptE [Pseudoalteromonas carrageenovora]
MVSFNAIKNTLALVLMCFVLSSCGFHLKKASSLPDNLKTLTLKGDDEKSTLFAALKNELKASNVELKPSAKDIAQLYLRKESIERQTLSLFQNGQVAEYELAYGVTYIVKRPGEKAIEKRFELYRNYQDDPDHALAKAKELELLISEIRDQASRRIVRELSQL